MKKTLLVLIILFFTTASSSYLLLTNIQNEKRNTENENSIYEEYAKKEIYGLDLATLINKAVDKNEKNKIAKDEKNYYIENDTNSLKIEIKMHTVDKTYAMEEIYNNNITEFVKYFNLEEFRCIDIKYHKATGKVAKMVFEEIV